MTWRRIGRTPNKSWSDSMIIKKYYGKQRTRDHSRMVFPFYSQEIATSLLYQSNQNQQKRKPTLQSDGGSETGV